MSYGISAANIHRRMMTKGQQAIAVAMVYPETAVGGKGKKAAGTKAAESAGFSYRRLEDARIILKHTPDLPANVLSDSLPARWACGARLCVSRGSRVG